jgi:hypothetical protein
LSGNAASVGTGAWSVVSGPSTSSSQFTDTSVYNTSFTPASGAGSYVVRWTIASAPCTASYADATVSVDAAPVGGSIAGGTETCSSTGTLTLSGHTGSVVRWEKANSPYTSWSTISNTTTTQSDGFLTESTKYRAILSNGVCTTNATSADYTVSISSTTWTGSAWSNGTPSSSLVAIISSAYSASANLSACALWVTNNTAATIPAGYVLTLEGKLVVDSGSTLTLENSANLMQNSTVANSGNVNIKRNTALLYRLDYTLWGSPVSGSQKLLDFSPETLTNRFYTYNPSTNLYNAVSSPSTTGFDLGKGYLIRMPNNWTPYSSGTPEAWTGTFTGTPNNGSYTVSGLATGGTSSTGYNAISNPYPSPINIPAFLSANSSAIEGTLWFWRKTNDAGNVVSYSTCTSAGCTLNNGHTYNDDQLISTGQGFFVQTKSGQSSVGFTNSMRRSTISTEFFKNGTQRNRFWLDLADSSNKKFSQNMIAYMPNATAGYDEGIDGLYINENPTALSSIVDNRELVITAKSDFTDTDVVPMQFRTNTAGNYTISLSRTEGVFGQTQTPGSAQLIYLRDNQTGTVTDLTQGSYTFASATGTTANRFDVLYQNPLSTTTPKFDENSVVAFSQNQLLQIYTGSATMQQVKVFDLRGRLLVTQSGINASQTTIDAKTMANQLLLVQITDTEGRVITKKVMN